MTFNEHYTGNFYTSSTVPTFDVSVRVTVLVMVTVCLVVGLGGCTGYSPSDDDLEGAEVVERMLEDWTAVEDVHGVVTQEVDEGDGGERMVHELWDRPAETNHRLEQREPDEWVLVSNESVAWTYDVSEGEATRYDLEEGELIMSYSTFSYYESYLDRFDVEYEGTATVAGRETHVVAFTSPTNETVETSIDVLVGETEYRIPLRTTVEEELVVEEHRLWVDAEHWYPLKGRTVLTGPDDESLEVSRTFEEVAFETGIDDERFEFDPPADVEVDEYERPDIDRYDDVDEAAAAVPFDIPDPDVPAGYDRQQITVSDRDSGLPWVTQSYEADDGDTFRFTTAEPFEEEPVGVTIQIGDREGIAYQGLESPVLYWECSGLSHRISGLADEEALLEVAESVECS